MSNSNPTIFQQLALCALLGLGLSACSGEKITGSAGTGGSAGGRGGASGTGDGGTSAGGSSGADSGGSGASAGTGGSGGGSRVTGIAIDRYIRASGDEQRPFASPILALVPEANGTFRQISATVDATGAFSLENVPEGPYFVERTPDPQYPQDSWLYTEQRALDLGAFFPYRPDVVFASEGSGVVVTTHTTQALQTTDEMDLCSPWSFTFTFVPVSAEQADKTVADFRHDLSPSAAGYAAGLISTNAGDRAFVTHLTQRMLLPRPANSGANAAPSTLLAATGSAEFAGLEILPGQFTNAEVTLSQGQEQTWQVAHDVAQYKGLLPQVGPTAELTFVFGTVDAGPGERCTIISSTLSDAALVDSSGSVKVNNPFSAAETSPIAAASGVYRVAVPGIDLYVSAKNHAFRELTDTSLNVAPLLGPPTQVTVNGSPANAAVTNAGLTPEVSWQAPTLGTANAYSVTVRRIDDQDPANLTHVLVGKVESATTKLRLPPGLLELGQRYIFVVRAVTGRVPGTAWEEILPSGSAETVTAVVTP